MIEEKVYTALGLNEEEYNRIVNILGRHPSSTEVAMYSVEWSEHCGYTKSRKYLKKFPKKGHYPVIISEDAGGIIVDDIAVVFKMESHNHPSQVEPKQGAATGIGGIIRDIFTCGARPIACLDSLRFGELADSYNRYLLKGVVDGIAFYGNCVGVPTVGGEIYFDDNYSGNCLVNAMCVGITEKDNLFRARAEGEGNPIIYVGSSTGRDGIGGCSVLASNEFGEGEQKRPTVQIGDPFTEKCLIEATMETIQTGCVLGIKDMGAAGLTCSSSEMAASGDVGIEIHLDRVPLRESGMTPWEIMMSESQERMLLCVKKGYEKKILDIFTKWDLNAVIIGEVIKDKNIKVYSNEEKVAELPTVSLTDPPLYDMPAEEPDYYTELKNYEMENIQEPDDYSKVLKDILAHPNIASKQWVWTQYDHMVQTNTINLPGFGSSVLRIKGTDKALAVTTDCNPYFCYLDPYIGSQIAVAEASRNVFCTGAIPAGVTDCLNFGSPDKPDRYWQFKNAVKGISEACSKLNIPIVSGNVSFYNESPKGAIFPTPTIGMVGVINDTDKIISSRVEEEGIKLIEIGENRGELGGTQYLKICHDRIAGKVPCIDLENEIRLQEIVERLNNKNLIKAALDISDGGLLVALFEMLNCDDCKMGVDVSLESQGIKSDALLFGESQSRIIIGVDSLLYNEVIDVIKNVGYPCKYIGTTQKDYFNVTVDGENLISVHMDELSNIYANAIPTVIS